MVKHAFVVILSTAQLMYPLTFSLSLSLSLSNNRSQVLRELRSLRRFITDALNGKIDESDETRHLDVRGHESRYALTA